MAFIGLHVNRYHVLPKHGVRPGITAHIEAARKEAEIEAGFKVTAASIFVGGPRDRNIVLHEHEGEELREYIRSTGIRVIAHNSYTASPWTGDPDAARFIREQSSVCQTAGITGIVVHLPKLPVTEVMRYIARLFNLNAPDVRIYLEIPAVRPNKSYYESPAKLATLFDAIRAKLDPELDYFGLCIDTAHLSTCGIDLRAYNDAETWLKDLELRSDSIPHNCVMIHLNDSLRPIGVGPDAHAPLAMGKIWETYRDNLGESGLAAFTDYAQRHDTPVILERAPKGALKNDYLILRKLIPDTAV